MKCFVLLYFSLKMETNGCLAIIIYLKKKNPGLVLFCCGIRGVKLQEVLLWEHRQLFSNSAPC